MTDATPCPSDHTLQQLVMGQLSGFAAAPLETHLETCSRCALTLKDMQCDDSLIAAVRSGAEVANAFDEGEDTGLIERLERMGKFANDVTADESIRESIRWLSPGQRPGELGRIGPYRVLDVLGSGGMGVVYLAQHTRLRRRVALKMILAGDYLGRERTARFQREAEVVSRLQHPGIVQLFEAGEHEGRPYLAMEYVAGGSLARQLSERLLTAREAGQLVETLATALHYAHVNGVVHRDLKPANILIQSQSGSFLPKITDFGLAKQIGTREKSENAFETRTGRVVGTPSYMPPEQVAGSAGEVGPAADVYGLGAILYECLTGRPPFRAATPLETLDLVRGHDPTPPRQITASLPRDLETICLTCLAKEPGKRYASAQDLSEDLGRFLRGEPIRSRRSGPGERLWKWAKRRPTAAALVLVSVLSAVTLLAGASFMTLRCGEPWMRPSGTKRKRGVSKRSLWIVTGARAIP